MQEEKKETEKETFKSENEENDMDKVFQILIILFVGIITSIVISLMSFFSISYMESEIIGISDALWLESEDHFLEVINDVKESTVGVIGCPASNDSDNVVIYVDENIGNCDLSSGFSFNENGNIITAYHGVGEKNYIAIIYDDLTLQEVNDISVNSVWDLAILNIETDIPKLEFESGIPQVGYSVGFIGFPLGENSKIATKGTISGYIPHVYHDEIIPVYTISAFVNKGNSGGAVFSLKTGKVIGIINQVVDGKQGIGISTILNQEVIDSMQYGDSSSFV